MTEIQSSSLSDRGQRQNNEDFAAFYEPTDPAELEQRGCLYIIADGVGGAAKGERASQFAAQKVLYEYYRQPAGMDPGERLRRIMKKVNEDIHSYADHNGTRMATTMVAVVVRKGHLHLVNVGDSRAYLIRAGEAKQLNRDHSIVGEMVVNGEMTEAEAMASRIKNRLTRSLGGEAEVHVDSYPPLPLSAGDKILLCSDGLTRYAYREKIAELTAQGSPQEITQRLIQYANSRGGADNISAILIAFQQADAIEEPVKGLVPQLPSWEIMETDPGIRTIQTPSLITNAWFRWVALGAGLLFLASATGYGILRQMSVPQISTPAPSTAVNLGVLSSQVPILSSVTTQSSPTQTSTATATPAQTNTPEPSPTESATSTFETPGAINGSTPANCSYKLQSGDYLSKVAEVFGIGSNNYKKIFCDPESAKSGCDLSKPSNVRAGWIVIIPDVSTGLCTTNNGTVLPANP